MPDLVAPGSVDELAAVLRTAAADGLAVVPRGGGTKRAWGAPPRHCDLVVELGGLDRIVDHAAGDMVVQVQAGVRLDRLAPVLAGAGQQLAVDVPAYDDGTTLEHGTVGGAIAAGLAGPRRLRYGAVRDLLLGVTMVRADGGVAASGGRVVKNVAGYDLGKLLCGSYGTLGVIVEATLRLHPLPAATGWLLVTAPDATAAYAAARTLLDSQLSPSAVEIDRPAGGDQVSVAALFEGTGEGADARARAAAGLVGGAVVDGPPIWWGRWPGSPAGTLVEISFPPAELVTAFDAVDAAAQAAAGAVPVRGSAGVAVLRLGLPEKVGPDAVASLLSVLREQLRRGGGAAIVRHAPAAVRDVVDVWGPVHPGTFALMRRVKYQFDPDHRLAPGCFVGGL